MSKTIKNPLSELKAYIQSTPSRVQKLVTGSKAPGTRATSAQTGKHDSNIGSRIDFGDAIQKSGKQYQRLKFQLNKNAANAQMKKLVQEQMVDDVLGEMEKKL